MMLVRLLFGYPVSAFPLNISKVIVRIEVCDPESRVVLMEPVSFATRNCLDGQPGVTSEEVGQLVRREVHHDVQG